VRPAAAPPAAPAAIGRPPGAAVGAALGVLVAVSADLLAGGVLERLDLRVSGAVDGWDLQHSAAYPLAWLLTQAGGRATLVALLVAVAGWLAWRRGVWRPAARAVLALAVLTVAVYAAKYGFGRTAPAYPGSYFHRGGASYPSGHVANAVVVWGVARWQAAEFGLPARVQGVLRVLAWVAPAVAAVAMVALDFHWVTDAVAGAAVGVVLLGVVHWLDAVALSRWVHGRDRAAAGPRPR
jgi:membrane-associated phospholipid phosphatase